jgi:hypothetical protein
MSSGINDCFADTAVCCTTSYCICVQECYNWVWSRGDTPGCYHCPCFVHAVGGRQNIRQARGLPFDFCGDCCLYAVCRPCCVCQDGRELKLLATGTDPAPPFCPSSGYASVQPECVGPLPPALGQLPKQGSAMPPWRHYTSEPPLELRGRPPPAEGQPLLPPAEGPPPYRAGDVPPPFVTTLPPPPGMYGPTGDDTQADLQGRYAPK